MIVQIQNTAEIDSVSLLSCRYGRRILHALAGYGTGYDFCRFFRIENGLQTAWLLLLNSTALLSTQDKWDGGSDELSVFLAMHQPFRIEGSQSILQTLQMDGYQKLHRSVFQLMPGGTSPQFDAAQINTVPRLDDVYAILAEGFPNLIAYDLWMADTSHMVRHGLRRCITYMDMSTASIVYGIGSQLEVRQVATRKEARGKGYARDMLRWLASEFDARRRVAVLEALDIRRSFYEEIGFLMLESEFVLEHQHELESDAGKGML